MSKNPLKKSSGAFGMTRIFWGAHGWRGAQCWLLNVECWIVAACRNVDLTMMNFDGLTRCLNTNNPNWTNIFARRSYSVFYTHTDLTDRTDLVRGGTLTWGLLNENDTNEINTDSTRRFVNTHCLCLVLKVESLYSFSPTMGKQAFIVLTYRKGARF